MEQKKFINEARAGLDNAVEKAGDSARRARQAQDEAGEAVGRADRAVRQAKTVEELRMALSEAKIDLRNAQGSLESAKEELESTKVKLENSKDKLGAADLENETVGHNANLFAIFRSGLFASLIANFLTTATFALSWPRRRLELRKGKVDLAIKEIQLQEMRATRAGEDDGSILDS